MQILSFVYHYELIVIGIFLWIFFKARYRNAAIEVPRSYLAIFLVLSVLLNPLLMLMQILFIVYHYELIAIGIFAWIFFKVRYRNATIEVPWSYLAIFSAVSVLLNPLLMHLVLSLVHYPLTVARGDDEIRSFLAGVISLSTGIIALVRIRKSRGKIRGFGLASIGVIGGTLWVVGWIVFILWFLLGMRGAH
jgi:hypothetical protein